MAKTSLILALVCGSALQASAWAQAPATPSTPQAVDPSTEAMAWDRDFDLLLELNNAPTKTQTIQEDKRKALLQEREKVLAHMTDLEARLAAVEGTYTTEAVLNEMLRQGVGEMLTAQDNLKRWIKEDDDRLKDLDAKLQKLAYRGGS